jgi:hypothetical protein
MQLHECFLDGVLGERAVAQQTQGITQERRFESLEQLFNRLESRRVRTHCFDWHWINRL